MRIGRYVATALAMIALLAVTPERAALAKQKGGAKARAAGSKTAKAPAKKLQRTQNVAPRGTNASERQLQDDLDAMLGEKTFATTRSGVYVVDMSSGRVLYSYGADDQLNPASNVKLVSTATALDALGPDFSYRTRLVGAAADERGVVHGDVWLIGMSDPTLREKDLAGLAAELAQRGVKQITGNLVVSGDPSRDVLGRPRVEVAVQAGQTEGDLPVVTVSPDSAYFVLDNRAVVNAKAKIARTCKRVRIGKGKKARRKKVCGAPQPAQLDVALRASEDGPAGPHVTIAVTGKLRPGTRYVVRRYAPHPAAFTGHTMRAHLQRAGIAVGGSVRIDDADTIDLILAGAPGAELAELAAHDSVPLGVLVAMVNKPSNNWLADRVAELVGGELFGEATIAAGVRAMGVFLDRIGVTPGSYMLENGSGLSYENHLSARQIGGVLMAGYKDLRSGGTFFASMSVAGKDGTLRGRFRGNESKGFVYGKTGTLTGVAALSGYVRLDQGGEQVICFVIVTNGYRNTRKATIRAGQARMVDAMYRHLRRHEAAGDAAAPAAPPPVLPVEVDDDDELGADTPENEELESDGTETMPDPAP